MLEKSKTERSVFLLSRESKFFLAVTNHHKVFHALNKICLLPSPHKQSLLKDSSHHQEESPGLE